MATIGDIAAFLKAEGRLQLVKGRAESDVRRPAPLSKAKAGDVTFLTKARKTSAADLQHCPATLAIVPDGEWHAAINSAECTIGAFLFSDRPRLDFIRVVQRFFDHPRQTGVHATAVIHPEAKIHPSVSIGAHTVIGRCFLDEGTVIHSGVHLYDNVRVGRNVLIHSGVVLGADGFGFEKIDDGTWTKFPHLGGVVIEDNIEIGANSCVDRGALDDTRIEEGTKIDNQVHIAHNVHIGRNCVITAGAVFSGSVTVEEDVWIGPGARIIDKIRIGRGAKIGIGAVVIQNVPPGSTVAAALSKSFKLES